MAIQFDVKGGSLAASGSIFAGRTRVKGFIVSPGSAGAGSVVLQDGATTVITVPTLANTASFSVLIPGDGIVFGSNVYATLANASVTVFYG